MSYSYLQSVFPNYKPSQKLTELLYNDIINNNNTKPIPKYEAANDNLHASVSQVNSKPLIVDNGKENKENRMGNNKHVENVIEVVPVETFKDNFKDNLRFYNEPLKSHFMENFEDVEQKEQCSVSCVDNINHILKCEGCTAILKQKLGINIDFNDYIEIAMYILFGLFIIAMLDKLDKK